MNSQVFTGRNFDRLEIERILNESIDRDVQEFKFRMIEPLTDLFQQLRARLWDAAFVGQPLSLDTEEGDLSFEMEDEERSPETEYGQLPLETDGEETTDGFSNTGRKLVNKDSTAETEDEELSLETGERQHPLETDEKDTSDGFSNTEWKPVNKDSTAIETVFLPCDCNGYGNNYLATIALMEDYNDSGNYYCFSVEKRMVLKRLKASGCGCFSDTVTCWKFKRK